MKTVMLQTSSETVRRRRTASTITRIEIGLPILKNETSFMSLSRRIASRSGSAQVLPDAHLEVDFFQAAGRGSGSRDVSGLRNFTLRFVQRQSTKPYAHLRVVSRN